MKCLVLTKFVPCPMRFSCSVQGWYRENIYVRDSQWVQIIAVAGYHAVVCDAFISHLKIEFRFWNYSSAYAGARGVAGVSHFITGHEQTQ